MMQLGRWYGNKVATEDIQNLSLCIMTDNGVRNIRSIEDLQETTVLVYNLPKINQDTKFIIKPGEYVRYTLASV